MASMVRFDGVGLRYGRAGQGTDAEAAPEVLHDLSFVLSDGAFRWPLGPSGAGKTSLLRLMYLAIRPTRGRLAIFGTDIETAARNRIAILTVVFNNGVMAAERDVLGLSTKKYGALTVGGNYAKVAEGLNVAATRVEKPADIVPAIKDAVAVTQSGAPFLLEIMAKEGYDFSRYPLAGL